MKKIYFLSALLSSAMLTAVAYSNESGPEVSDSSVSNDNAAVAQPNDTDEQYQQVSFVYEDFSKITVGSEDAPGGSFSLNFPDNYTELPNWTCGDARTAGGSVFLGSYPNASYPGKGFITTPKVDMSAAGSRVIVTFRARLTEMPENQDGETPEKDLRNVNLAFRTYNSPLQKAPIQLSTEWQTYEVTFENGDFQTNVAFYGHNVLIDDIHAYGLVKSLPSPENLSFSDLSAEGFTAEWAASEDPEVTGYLLSLFTKDKDDRVYLVENLEVADNSYSFSDLDMDEVYYFVVKATDGNRTSVESAEIEVFGMFKAPEAKQPADITRDEFTAQWEGLKNAENYMVSSYILHTAPENEYYPIIDEDFNAVNAEFMAAGYLDNILNRAQWYAYYLNCEEEGCLTFNNIFNFMMPGTLVSPMFDIPSENPTVRVSFKIKSNDVSAVQLSLGNGNYPQNTFVLNQNNKANVMIYPTTEWKEHEYVLTGSTGYFSQLVLQAKDGDGTFSIDNLKVEVALDQYQQVIIPKYAVSTPELSATISTRDCFYGDLIAYDVYGYRRNQKGVFVTSPASQLMPVMTTYPERPEPDDVGVASVSLEAAGVSLSGNEVFAPGLIRIYDLGGNLVTEGTDHVVLPATGLYIVATEAGTCKVAVR